MSAITKTLLACSMSLALAAPALAHHSAAAYDTQKELTVTGTVLQYRFANPHVYLTLQVKRDDGSTSTIEVEAGAAAVLNGLGRARSRPPSPGRGSHRAPSSEGSSAALADGRSPTKARLPQAARTREPGTR
jgi:hypothetical protein